MPTFPTLNKISDVKVTEYCQDEKKSPLNDKQLELKCWTTISLEHSDSYFGSVSLIQSWLLWIFFVVGLKERLNVHCRYVFNLQLIWFIKRLLIVAQDWFYFQMTDTQYFLLNDYYYITHEAMAWESGPELGWQCTLRYHEMGLPSVEFAWIPCQTCDYLKPI